MHLLGRGLTYHEVIGDRATVERHTTAFLYTETRQWGWTIPGPGSGYFPMRRWWSAPVLALERSVGVETRRWLEAAAVLVQYRVDSRTQRFVRTIALRRDAVLLVRQDDGVYRLPEGVWHEGEASM